MKTIIALLTLLVLMGGAVFAYWVVPAIMTAPAQPSLESADTWCEEAVRTSWKWQSANKWCSDNLLSIVQDGPCRTVVQAGIGAMSCEFNPVNCLAECKKAVSNMQTPEIKPWSKPAPPSTGGETM